MYNKPHGQLLSEIDYGFRLLWPSCVLKLISMTMAEKDNIKTAVIRVNSVTELNFELF